MLTTYYAPYPTMSNMRGLGQTGAGVWPADLYRHKVMPAYQGAAELDVALPRPPAGLGDKGTIGWEMLAQIDIIGARLDRAFTALMALYRMAGSHLCRDLLQYNNAAQKFISIQTQVITMCRQLGVPGTPENPPLPKLFTNMDACTSPTERVKMATPDDPDGVGVHAGCGAQLGAAHVALTYWGLAAIISVAAHYVIKNIAVQIGDAEALQLQVKAAGLEAEFKQKQAERVRRLAQWCRDAGGDPIDCVYAAGESVSQVLEVLRGNWARDRKAEKGRGWLWWIGLAAVAAGGVVIYKIVKKKRRTVRRIPRAELVEVED